jgi:hypothetical protein
MPVKPITDSDFALAITTAAASGAGPKATEKREPADGYLKYVQSMASADQDDNESFLVKDVEQQIINLHVRISKARPEFTSRRDLEEIKDALRILEKDLYTIGGTAKLDPLQIFNLNQIYDHIRWTEAELRDQKRQQIVGQKVEKEKTSKDLKASRVGLIAAKSSSPKDTSKDESKTKELENKYVVLETHLSRTIRAMRRELLPNTNLAGFKEILIELKQIEDSVFEVQQFWVTLSDPYLMQKEIAKLEAQTEKINKLADHVDTTFKGWRLL